MHAPVPAALSLPALLRAHLCWAAPLVRLAMSPSYAVTLLDDLPPNPPPSLAQVWRQSHLTAPILRRARLASAGPSVWPDGHVAQPRGHLPRQPRHRVHAQPLAVPDRAPSARLRVHPHAPRHAHRVLRPLLPGATCGAAIACARTCPAATMACAVLEPSRLTAKPCVLEFVSPLHPSL
eukprot:364071-Chlamydomonas_euryale.AAC.8